MKSTIKNCLWLCALGTFAALSAGGACNKNAGPDGGDSGGTQHPAIAGAADPNAPVALTTDGDEAPAKRGFEFVLRPGTPPNEGPATPAQTPSKPLSAADADKLLNRLPRIGDESGDVVDFALREGSKPPPLTGETISAPFPPPVAPDVGVASVDTKEPGVLRFQPEGDVPLAPRITITFATPMVAVTSHDTLAFAAVPATLTPAIDGHWRWVGTKTLYFDPVGRAPMATDFTVTVPAGVKDALGKPLATGTTFKFRTPAPRIISSLPSGDNENLTPLFFALFDQRIDAALALKAVVVKAGDKTVKVRALTEKEATLELKVWADNADIAGRWVAFRAADPLPKDTRVSVTFPKGFGSAEGPRTTDKDLRFDFKTYGPFAVRRSQCGWSDECYPGMPYGIQFTNSIDETSLKASQIKVEPTIVGFTADVSGETLSLSGMTRGRTDYDVVLSKDLKDIYGQTLGKEIALEWKVGPSRALLTSNIKPMTVLDPAAKKRRLPVYVMNMDEVEVALYRVTPDDWPAYLTYVQNRWNDDEPRVPPGKEVFSKTIKTGAPAEEFFELGIDLSPALDGEFGQVITVVRPTGIKEKWERLQMTITTWVQSTQIGLDAFSDAGDLVVWATNLADGKPIDGASVTLTPPNTLATTDANGLARIALGEPQSRQHITIKSGNDVAFLPDDFEGWGNGGAWAKRPTTDQMRWLVFDDRHLYRPEETVSVKGIVRRIESGKKGDVAFPAAGEVTRVQWHARDSRNNELGKGEAAVSALGTFHMDLKLPKTPNLGGAHIEFSTNASVPGGSHHHYFDIQEFRRPEFEVSSSVSEGPHIVGGTATVSVSASYFAGGPLPNAEVTWSVSATPGGFSPPNHDEFVFGRWTPWWHWRGGGGGDDWNAPYRSLEGRTDSSGTHMIALDLNAINPPQAVSISAEATVQDVNRQTWSTSTPVLVHPAATYVGMKTQRWFVAAGKAIDVALVATDIDGNRQDGVKIAVKAVRLEWKKVGQSWDEVEVDAETCDVVSGKDPVSCTFKPKAGGRHAISASIKDKAGRPNESSLSVWVPGGKGPVDRDLKQEDVTIIPSKKQYEPGETAEFLVQSPFFPASGVYIVAREGMVETVPFELTGDTATLKIAIEEWMIPGFQLQVFLNGSADRPNDDGTLNPNVPRRPAFAHGRLDVAVPPTLRRLTVTATPAAARIEPGADTTVSVSVVDAAGKPAANAEVALIVVDEAVLALSGHSYPDPVAAFYGRRDDGTVARHLRTQVMLAAAAELYAAVGNMAAEQQMKTLSEKSMRSESADGAGMPPPSPAPSMAAMAEAPSEEAPGGPAAGPIAVRKNFDALAVFLPDGKTDATGRIVVPVKLPDNLTRYRVVAIALHGAKHFGKGESAVTARLPLMVRMSAPRFLNFGDRFELPVVLQNQTDTAMEVQVAVRATNASVVGDKGRLVSVPANDRVEVRIPMAAEKPGTARFQAGAASGRWADAAEVKLPVWTPATTEAFATYGEIDKGGMRQPVQLPGEVVTAFGGLDIQTSSTQLQALTDAVVYLVTYPYECAEQISSRMMSLAALKDVLTAFKAPGLPSPEALIASVDQDIKRLRGMQGYDGGFAFWRRDQETWPFLTVHVTHALLRAKAKGFTVPDGMLNEALGYLRNIRQHMTKDWYSEAARRSIESFALYVRNLAGDNDAARAAAILKEEGGADKANLELVGWLYPVFTTAKRETELASIRKHLNNRVSETAGAAHFVTSYGDGAYLLLHSERRVDGILLEGLIGDQPTSDLIPKLVRGLLGHKTAGRWHSTQENAWVLLALDRYFAVFEKDEPNFKVQAWLGQLFAGEHVFKGRTTERYEIAIPMQQLADLGGKADLTLAKTGPGRMYYRIGMRYAPKSLKLEPADHGFFVERVYESVDKPDDVTKDSEGRWVIRAGARVKVKLTMHTEDRRYHVALVDPMPAGLEALNPDLLGSQAPPIASDDDESGGGRGGRIGRGSYCWWWGPWYEHDNLRDERAEAFTSLLWEGVYTYNYYARATTLGTFIVPPPKAEEMYAPETFGRGASDIVIVK